MTGHVYFLAALLLMAGITYLIRLLPLLFVRKRIKNIFVMSFLYYAPYVVLSVIAFPAILLSTSLLTGIMTVVVCVYLAYRRKGLIVCMAGSVFTAVICELITMLL